MAAGRTGGNTGGIGLGGILVIVGIVLMIIWSFWIGLIIALIGLIAFGGFAKGIATGLAIRHDHGSAYMSDDFQRELTFLGMTSSPSFVREPEGNGVELKGPRGA